MVLPIEAIRSLIVISVAFASHAQSFDEFVASKPEEPKTPHVSGYESYCEPKLFYFST